MRVLLAIALLIGLLWPVIAVAGKMLENVLQEDPKLLMWYDQALTRSGVE